MLIYGVSGIFALKKTIKQFLQPVIERVLGGGGGGGGGAVDVLGGCAAFSVSVFQSYCIFVLVFFNSLMPFLGRFYQYLHIFCCILCVFYHKVKQCFGHKIFVMYN